MTCDNHGIMLIISYAKGEYCPLFEESKPYLKIVVNWEAYADKALKILNKINAFFDNFRCLKSKNLPSDIPSLVFKVVKRGFLQCRRLKKVIYWVATAPLTTVLWFYEAIDLIGQVLINENPERHEAATETFQAVLWAATKDFSCSILS